MWAGASDVAQVFRSNAEDSEPVRAHRALLWGLAQAFGANQFKAAEVVTAGLMHATARDTLRSALEALRVKSLESPRSVAHVLTSLVGKTAEVDGVDLKLAKRTDGHDKVDLYSVAGFAGV